MKNYLLILFAFIMPMSCFSQLFSPESIEYYPKGNYYFVSNAGNGTIQTYDNNGKVSLFVYNLYQPKGLCNVGDTLYVADQGNLFIIDIPSQAIASKRVVTGASFLNDICYDGKEFLYITDTQKNKIFKYNIITQEIYDLQLKGNIIAPNGIIHKNGMLLGVSFIQDSPIWQVKLSNNEVSQINMTTLDYLDGIQIDEKSTVYLSSWANPSQQNVGIIYRLENIFSSVFEPIKGNLNGPADILFHNNRLLVPEMNANKITIIDFNSIEEENKIEVSMNGILQLPEEIFPPYTIEIYNILGNLAVSETTNNSTYKIDLPTGTYFVRINNRWNKPVMISR